MNKIYIDVDTVRKLLELDAKNIKLAIDVIPKVKDILKRFDGKQITKRIQSALDGLDCDRFYVTSTYKNECWELNICMKERCIASKPDKNGCCGASYCNYDRVSLLTLCNKRTVVDYKYVEKEIDSTFEYMKNVEKSRLNDVQHVEEYLSKYNKFVENYDKLMSSMGSGFRSYAGI